jgi:hypothetical protein
MMVGKYYPKGPYRVGDTYIADHSGDPHTYWTFQIIFSTDSFAVAAKINRKGFIIGPGQIICVDNDGREIEPAWDEGFYFFKTSGAKSKDRIGMVAEL